MNIEPKLLQIRSRHAEVEKSLGAGNLSPNEIIALNKEYARLDEIVPLVNAYFAATQNIQDAEKMLKDDPEMRSLAEEELARNKDILIEVEQNIKMALLPRDDADDRSVIMEIRAGVGGDEGGIFAGDLFRQYQGYAARRGWKIEVIDENPTELNGYKEIIFRVVGRGAFARLKFESGIHRVQRVPETEAGGRVHTSAASVAVMPEAEEIDVNIDEKDLRIDTYRSSGAGGQHVNKTDSAVRITHIPTGVVSASQNERSQVQNKANAMKMLLAKLYEKQRLEQQSSRDSSRRAQVGSGDRSEKIRTYNFPDQRVTDHRIKFTQHSLDAFMLGGDGLDNMIDALTADYQLKLLTALEGENDQQ
ncbi:MAG: peptide chain release factor 1 [Rickettsiales bacterium]|jgi:peptide chain release factor 1|nr:peptide chain release factor 1 [Rickettsiales bacterium]